MNETSPPWNPADWPESKLADTLNLIGRTRRFHDESPEDFATFKTVLSEAARRIEFLTRFSVRVATDKQNLLQQIIEWSEYGASQADMAVYLKGWDR